MTRTLLVLLVVGLVCLSTQAAVLVDLSGSYCSAFLGLGGTQNVWNPTNSGTPTSPSNAAYTGPEFWGVFGASFTPDAGSWEMINAQRYIHSEPYIGTSAQAPSGTDSGTSVALVAPMFKTPASYNGSFDSIEFTGRGYGSSGPRAFRLLAEADGVTYISDEVIPSGQAWNPPETITVPGSGSWNIFDTSDPFLQNALVSSSFDGTGNISAIGLWLTETTTGTSSAGYGIKAMVFEGTPIPEPATMMIMAAGIPLLLKRRRK